MRPRLIAIACTLLLAAAGALVVVLTRGDDVATAKSSMRRWLEQQTSPVPVATWLLEEGPLAQASAPLHGSYSLTPFTGTHPSGAVVTYPRFGSGSLAPWLPPVLSRTGSAGLTILRAPVQMPSFVDEWAVDFVYASGSDAASSTVDVNPSYLPGGALGWPQLTLDGGTGLTVSFGGNPEVETLTPGLYDGLAHHIRWHATQDGTDIDWVVYIDGVAVQTDTEATETLPAVTQLGLSASAQSGAQSAMGYVSVWTTPASVTDAAAAALGHPGETAAVRFARLCAENSVAYDVAT